jgi:hypothetical protein
MTLEENSSDKVGRQKKWNMRNEGENANLENWKTQVKM